MEDATTAFAFETTAITSNTTLKARWYIRKSDGTTVKFNLNDPPQRVYHTVWMEPVEDPRQAIGYELEDGTPFFDHVVMLYGMRSVISDCASIQATNPEWACNLTGLHACIVGNMHYYLENTETYFKPIQDNGQKVLLSLVPSGLADCREGGVAVGALFNWPHEATHPWAVWSGGRPYPLNEEASMKLVNQIADLLHAKNIDGIAYDEEYAGNRMLVDPSTGQSVGISVYGGTSSDNLLRFAYELDKAMKARGREEPIIQEIYDIRISLQPTATFTDSDGELVTVNRNDLILLSYTYNYGGWVPDSAHPGFPRERYGPASIAIADVPGNSPRPPLGIAGGIGIIPRMREHLIGNYGVIMYYCLRSRVELEKGIPD